MNALIRALRLMTEYEDRLRADGGYPSAASDALLRRAEVYAAIAQAQELRARNDAAGIVTANTAASGEDNSLENALANPIPFFTLNDGVTVFFLRDGLFPLVGSRSGDKVYGEEGSTEYELDDFDGWAEIPARYRVG